MPHLVNYSAESQTGVCRTCIAKQARAPKTCANCSQPLHANATPGTWCTACAFPPCSGCGQPRPHKSSHHAKQKPNWLCKSCTAAPKCGNCAGPLPRNAEAGTWCATCAYPPCSGGCGETRPHERRYHAQHKPLWLCQACSVRNGYPPCPMCGLQRPQERRYHVKVMPHWTCEACTVKSCPKCGEVRGSKAQTGALCLACAYPPCESCGSQRPQESRYRVNVMPQWTCEACSVKSCPKCGQILGPKAQDGAWCLACAYPPCASCGRPRPRTRSEYHAQVMPTWTCEACSGNSPTGVPQKRLRRG